MANLNFFSISFLALPPCQFFERKEDTKSQHRIFSDCFYVFKFPMEFFYVLRGSWKTKHIQDQLKINIFDVSTAWKYLIGQHFCWQNFRHKLGMSEVLSTENRLSVLCFSLSLILFWWYRVYFKFQPTKYLGGKILGGQIFQHRARFSALLSAQIFFR